MFEHCKQKWICDLMFPLYTVLAGNMLLLTLWGDDHGPWMQALHLVFGLGAVTGPLVDSPFLSSTLDEQNETVIYANSTMTMPHQESQIWIIYFISGTALLVSATCSFLTYMTGGDRSVLLHKDGKAKQLATSDKNNSPIYRNTITVLMYLFVTVLTALELGCPTYLTTYSVDYLHWSKPSGALLTAAYFASYSFARAVGIVLIKFFQPSSLLLASCIGAVIFSVPIPFFATYHTPVLWVCIIGLGLSVATVFPTSITWVNSHIVMTGPIMSTFMVASTSGEALSPLVIGTLFTQYGIGSYPYVLLGFSIVTLMLYGILLAGAKISHNISMKSI